MKSIFTLTLALVLYISPLRGQQATTVDFESAGLPLDTFLNRAPANSPFQFESVHSFFNDYNVEFDSWTGWAVSTMRDVSTEGFTNQYSAITGGGVDSSDTYLVSYQFAANQVAIEDCCFTSGDAQYTGVSVTNATYPYLSMKNGDAFAKKFGGASGDDPDFLLLTIKGYSGFVQNELGDVLDSIEVYLADFRFEDNSLDFLLDEWLFVDLTPLRDAGSLTFTLTSSDVGMFGVNTPTYFCIDNLEYDLFTSTTEVVNDIAELYPNPTTDRLTVNLELTTIAPLSILNSAGQVVKQMPAAQQYEVDVQQLPTGIYTVVAVTENGTSTQRFVRN